MAFQDEPSPSIPAKTLLSESILAEIMISAAITSGYSELLIHLPMLDKHLSNKYGNEFEDYAKQTKNLSRSFIKI